MAEPHSLKAGDVVRHPDWPEGVTRTLTGRFSLGERGGYNEKGRYVVKKFEDERYMQLDAPVQVEDDEEDDYWAEAGLEKVP